MAKQYWLMKSEPGVFSIDDLQREKKTCWDGVRNYQARNFMRDTMQVGDEVLFYHSNAEPSGVAGRARICKTAYPDFSAWDKKSKHFDPKSPQDKPTWYMVDIAFVERFPELLPLGQLKADPALSGMMVIQKGSRLSVQPVTKKHFDRVVHLARERKI